MRELLMPLARVVTPNIPEAEALSGLVIDSRAALVAAARAIRKLGPRAVIIKGGHSMPATAGHAIDVLFAGRTMVEFAAPRLPQGGAHGTGCAFAAAITAYLARGVELEPAVRRAKQFVTRALRGRFALGAGRPVLDHFAASKS